MPENDSKTPKDIKDIHVPEMNDLREVDTEYVNSLYDNMSSIFHHNLDQEVPYSKSDFIKDFKENPDRAKKEYVNVLSQVFSKEEVENLNIEEKISKNLIKQKDINEYVNEKEQALESFKDEMGLGSRIYQTARGLTSEINPVLSKLQSDEKKELEKRKREYRDAVAKKNRIRTTQETVYLANLPDVEEMSEKEIKSYAKEHDISETAAENIIQTKKNEGIEKYMKNFSTFEGNYNPYKNIKNWDKGKVLLESEHISSTDKEIILDSINELKETNNYTKIQEGLEEIKENHINSLSISENKKKKLRESFNVIATEELMINNDDGLTFAGHMNNAIDNYKNLEVLTQHLKEKRDESLKETPEAAKDQLLSKYAVKHNKLVSDAALAEEAQKTYGRMIKVMNKKTALGEGLGSTDWADIATAGLKGLGDMADQYDISNKIKKGAALSKGEQEYVNAVGQYMDFMHSLSENSTNFENAMRTIGQGIPETLSFIAQFALTSGVGRSVTAAGTKTMEKLLKYGAKETTKGFGKRLGRFAATKALPAATTGIPTQAALMFPSYGTPALKEMRGQVVPDMKDPGEYTIDLSTRKDAIDTIPEAYGDIYQEVLTETAGFAFAKIPAIGKLFGRSMRKAIPKMKNLPKVKVFGPTNFKSKFAKSYRQIHKTTGVGNIFEEMGEEELNFLMDAIKGEYKPEDLQTFFTDQFIMMGTLTPITGFGTVSTIMSGSEDRAGMSKIQFKDKNGKLSEGWMTDDILRDINEIVNEEGLIDGDKVDDLMNKYKDKISITKEGDRKKEGKKTILPDNSDHLILTYVAAQSSKKTTHQREKAKQEAKGKSAEDIDKRIPEITKEIKELKKKHADAEKEGNKKVVKEAEAQIQELEIEKDALSKKAHNIVAKDEDTSLASELIELNEIHNEVSDNLGTPAYDDLNEKRREKTKSIKEKFNTVEDNDVDLDAGKIDVDDILSEEGTDGQEFVIQKKYGKETINLAAKAKADKDGNVTLTIDGKPYKIQDKDKVYTFKEGVDKSIYFGDVKKTAPKEEKSQSKESGRYDPSIGTGRFNSLYAPQKHASLLSQLKENPEAGKEGQFKITETVKDRFQGMPYKDEARAFYIEDAGGREYRVFPKDKNQVAEEIPEVKNGQDVSVRIKPKEEWNPKGEIKRPDGTPYGDRLDVYVGDKLLGYVAETDFDKVKKQKQEAQEKSKETEQKAPEEIKTEQETTEEKDIDTSGKAKHLTFSKKISSNSNVQEGLNSVNEGLGNIGTPKVIGEEKKDSFRLIFDGIVQIGKGYATEAGITASEVLDNVRNKLSEAGFNMDNINSFIKDNYNDIIEAINELLVKAKKVTSAETYNGMDAQAKTEKQLSKYSEIFREVSNKNNVDLEDIQKAAIDFTHNNSFIPSEEYLPQYLAQMRGKGKIMANMADTFVKNGWGYDELASFHREWRDTEVQDYVKTYYNGNDFRTIEANTAEASAKFNENLEKHLVSDKMSDDNITKIVEEYRQKTRGFAANSKDIYDAGIKLLSELTGLDESLWADYMSARTNETVVYMKKKTDDGKITFAKVSFENYKDMTNIDLEKMNSKKFDEAGVLDVEDKPGKFISQEVYYNRNNKSIKKEAGITNTLVGKFMKASESKQTPSNFVREFFTSSAKNARSNFDQLASVTVGESVKQHRFLGVDGNMVSSLLFKNMVNNILNNIEEKVHKDALKDNKWYEHFKEKGTFPKTQIRDGFYVKQQQDKKGEGITDEKIIRNDFIGNQFMEFVNSNIEYNHWMGQFGDKSNIIEIEAPKYNLPEDKAEREKIIVEIPNFNEDVELVKDAIGDHHYEKALSEEQRVQVEDFIYSWHMNDVDLSRLLLGNDYKKVFDKNFIEATKRKGQLISTGTQYLTDIDGGLDETYTAAIIEDLKIGNDLKGFDGIEFCTDTHLQQCAKSSGSITNKLEFYNGVNSTSKELSIGFDKKTGDFYLYKTNKVNISLLARHDPERYGALHEWMVTSGVDRVVPKSGAKAHPGKALKLFDDNGKIIPLNKSEIKEYVVDRNVSDIYLQQDLRHSSLPSSRSIPIQIYTNILSLKDNIEMINKIANIQSLGVAEFEKDFAQKTEREKINILLEKGSFDQDPEVKEYFERDNATLNSPEYKNRIRKSIMSYFEKAALQVKLNRTVAIELPADNRLKGYERGFYDRNGNERCSLPEVDASIDGAREAEYYKNHEDAVFAIDSDRQTYVDMIDKDGNIKEWEIREIVIDGKIKYKLPGEPVLVPRVPAHGTASHLVHRLNKNIQGGNFVILDKNTQIRSGSDFDGDVRYLSVRQKISKPYNRYKNAANEFFDKVVEEYENADNYEKNIQPIRIERFDTYIDEKAKNETDTFNSFGSAISQRYKNTDGQAMRGITTNLSAAFSVLSSGKAKLTKPFSVKIGKGTQQLDNIIEDKDGYIKALMGDLQNMAFDNNAKTRLTYIGLNPTTANMYYLLLMTNKKFDTTNDIEAEINKYMRELDGFFSQPIMKDFIRGMMRKNSPATRMEKKKIWEHLKNKYGEKNKELIATLKQLEFYSGKLFGVSTLTKSNAEGAKSRDDLNKLQSNYENYKNNPEDFGFKFKDENNLLSLLDNTAEMQGMLMDEGYAMGMSVAESIIGEDRSEQAEKSLDRLMQVAAINEQRPTKKPWKDFEKGFVAHIKTLKKNHPDNALLNALDVKETEYGASVQVLDGYKYGAISHEKLKDIKESSKELDESSLMAMAMYLANKHGLNNIMRTGNFYGMLNEDFKAKVGKLVDDYIKKGYDKEFIVMTESKVANLRATYEKKTKDGLFDINVEKQQETADVSKAEQAKPTNNIDNQIPENSLSEEFHKGTPELQKHIERQMRKKYGDVKIFKDRQAFFDFVEEHGGELSPINLESIGMAFKNAAFIDPNNAMQDTMIHEFGHIYYNALPAGNLAKIRLRKLFKEEGLSKKEVDEKVIKAVGQAGVNIAMADMTASKYKKFIDALKNFWREVKMFFGKYSKEDLVNSLAHDIWTNKRNLVGQDFFEKRIDNMIKNPEANFTVEEGENGHVYKLYKDTENEQTFTGLTGHIKTLSGEHFAPDVIATNVTRTEAMEEFKQLKAYVDSQEQSPEIREKLRNKYPYLDSVEFHNEDTYEEFGNKMLVYKEDIKNSKGQPIHNKEEPLDCLSLKKNLDENKKKLREKWEFQKQAGTIFHNIAEAILKGENPQTIENRYKNSFESTATINKIVKQFQKIKKSFEDKGYEVIPEKIVYDEKNKVASPADIYLRKETEDKIEVVIIDLKTSLNEWNDKKYKSTKGRWRVPFSKIANNKKQQHKYQVEMYAVMAEQNEKAANPNKEVVVSGTRIQPFVYQLNESNTKISDAEGLLDNKIRYHNVPEIRERAAKMLNHIGGMNKEKKKNFLTEELKEHYRKFNISEKEITKLDRAIYFLSSYIEDLSNPSVEEIGGLLNNLSSVLNIKERLEEEGYSEDKMDDLTMKEIVHKLKDVDEIGDNEAEKFLKKIKNHPALGEDYGLPKEPKDKEITGAGYKRFNANRKQADEIWERIGTLEDFSSLQMEDLKDLYTKALKLDHLHGEPILSLLTERHIALFLTSAMELENNGLNKDYKFATQFMGEVVENGLDKAIPEYTRSWGVLNKIGMLKSNKAQWLTMNIRDVDSQNRLFQMFAQYILTAKKAESRQQRSMKRKLDDIREAENITNEDIKDCIVQGKFREVIEVDPEKKAYPYLKAVYDLMVDSDSRFRESELKREEYLGARFRPSLPITTSFILKEEIPHKFTFMQGEGRKIKKLHSRLRPQKSDGDYFRYKGEFLQLHQHKKSIVNDIEETERRYKEGKIDKKEAIKTFDDIMDNYEKNLGKKTLIAEGKHKQGEYFGEEQGIKMAISGRVNSTVAIRSDQYHYSFLTRLSSLIHNETMSGVGLIGEYLKNSKLDTKGNVKEDSIIGNVTSLNLEKWVYKTFNPFRKVSRKDSSFERFFRGMHTYTAKLLMGFNLKSNFLTNIPAGYISNLVNEPEAMANFFTDFQKTLLGGDAPTLISAVMRFMAENDIATIVDDRHLESVIQEIKSKDVYRKGQAKEQLFDKIKNYFVGEVGAKIMFGPLEISEKLIQVPHIMGMMTQEQKNFLISEEKKKSKDPDYKIQYHKNRIFSKRDIINIENHTTNAQGLYGGNQPIWRWYAWGKITGMMWAGYAQSYIKRWYQAPGTNVLNQEISGYWQSIQTVVGTAIFNLGGIERGKKIKEKLFRDFMNIDDDGFKRPTLGEAKQLVRDEKPGLSEKDIEKYIYEDEHVENGKLIKEYIVANMHSIDNYTDKLATKQYIEALTENFTDDLGFPVMEDIFDYMSGKDEMLEGKIDYRKMDVKNMIKGAVWLGVAYLMKAWSDSYDDKQDELKQKYNFLSTNMGGKPVYYMSPGDKLRYFLYGMLGFRLRSLASDMFGVVTGRTVFSTMKLGGTPMLSQFDIADDLVREFMNRGVYKQSYSIDKPIGSSSLLFFFLKKIPGISANADIIMALFNTLANKEIKPETKGTDFSIDRYTYHSILNKIERDGEKIVINYEKGVPEEERPDEYKDAGDTYNKLEYLTYSGVLGKQVESLEEFQTVMFAKYYYKEILPARVLTAAKEKSQDLPYESLLRDLSPENRKAAKKKIEQIMKYQPELLEAIERQEEHQEIEENIKGTLKF